MTDALDIFILFYVFFFGSVVGSFLNVVIHRLPRSRYMGSDALVCPHCEKEIWTISCPHCGHEIKDEDPRPGPSKASGARSHCPKCGAMIRWYDNIPILSYLFLRGRCRSCKERISARYPLVELLAGLFAVASFRHFGPSPAAGIYFAFLSALIVVSFIDLDFFRIPLIVTIPGIIIGLALSPWLPGLGLLRSATGALAGAGGLYLIRRVYLLVRGSEGMGAGDADLLAMMGAFLGLRGVALGLMAASLLGAAIGLVLMAVQGRGGRLRVPFGPFLSAGAMIALFFGDLIMRLYLPA